MFSSGPCIQLYFFTHRSLYEPLIEVKGMKEKEEEVVLVKDEEEEEA